MGLPLESREFLSKFFSLADSSKRLIVLYKIFFGVYWSYKESCKDYGKNACLEFKGDLILELGEMRDFEILCKLGL